MWAYRNPAQRWLAVAAAALALISVVIKLRRVLHSLDPQQGIDLLLDRLRKTRTNIEFLMQIAKTSPGADDGR